VVKPDVSAPDLDSGLVRHRWSESDRLVVRTVLRPAQRFAETEASGAVVMLVAAVIAVVWANSPWQDSYFELWGTELSIELGHLAHIDLDLQGWVNDGLMAIFFFVVALEIKRELTSGELNDPKKAALPAMAALGGMVLPAAIYLAFNSSGPASDGWGIPVATDIAFAVGVVALVGPRLPGAAKTFLLTLAIVDDVGGIIIIAIFYTDDLSLGWLAIAAAGLFAVVLFTRIYVRSNAVFLVLGLCTWFALHESGVHATLAGVALGLLTPAWAFHNPALFGSRARDLVDRIQATFDDDGELTHDEHDENEARIAELTRIANESTSPLSRYLYALGPVVAFGIVPLFALANAGVVFTSESFDGLVTDPVVLGIVLGLVVGKTVGVFSFTWLGARLGLGRLPEGVTWAQALGLAVTAGIGFTVALFITGLAFVDAALVDSAKIGIFVASIVAGVAGYLTLRAAAGGSVVKPSDRSSTA
jgi:NhaA family Na+:H+ antiporter